MAEETKLCTHCKTAVAKGATRCPHCQGDLRSDFRKHPILYLVVIFFLAVVIGSGSGSSSSSSAPEQTISSYKTMTARNVSKRFAESLPLKAPATAKYEYPTIKEVPGEQNVYEASSFIDSQNSFGAMVRTTWSVKLKYVGPDTKEAINQGENWKIIEEYIDGEKIKLN